MSNRKCYSPLSLTAELELVHRQVSLHNTEKSIEQSILRLIQCCDNGGCEFATEMLTGIRSLSRPLNRAINSDRSRLSCLAIELVTALLAGLGTSFELLIAPFLPTLLGLCARTNKVFAAPAKTCVLAVIRGTKSPSLLPCLAKSSNHKSPSVRLVAAEGVLAYLGYSTQLDIAKDTRRRLLEDVIKLTTRDANTDVRQTGKKIFEIYKALLPGHVESFIAPLSPVTKKHLAVQGMAASQLISQVLPRGHRASGRVIPVKPLVAQKVTSSQLETRARPLSSEPKQGTNATRPIIMSNGMSSGPQPLPMQNRGQRSGVAPPLAPIMQRPQVGDMFTKPSDRKVHLKGDIQRISISTAPLSDISITRAIRKTSLPTFNRTSQADFPDTTKTHSVNSTFAIKPSSRTGPLPVVKAEPRVARGTSSRMGKAPLCGTTLTEAEVRTSSQACRSRVVVPRVNEQAKGQDKPVWGGRPVVKGHRPVVETLLGEINNSDTTGTLRYPIPTTCPTAVSLPSSLARSPYQSCLFKAPASGEISVPATSIHIPRDMNHPYIDVTYSQCDVNMKTPTIAILKTFPVKPVHHEDLFTSSHDGYAPSSVSNRLRRVPDLPRSIWNYRRDYIADTPSPCGILPQESDSTPSNKGSSIHRDDLSAPNGQHLRPSELPPSKLPPFKSFELPPLPPFEFPSSKLPSFKPFELPPLPPFEFPLPKLPSFKPFELPPSELPPSKPIKPSELPLFEIPLPKLPPFKPYQLPPLPSFELPLSNLKPFELSPRVPSHLPMAFLREFLEKRQLPQLPILHKFRMKR